MSDKKVGRGKPPESGQFGRGQRRAAGRPKGAKGQKTIVREIAAEVHEVQLGGRKQKVTTYELLILTMRDMAMAGDLRAAKWLDGFRANQNLDGESGGFLVVPETQPIEMFTKEIEFRNRYAVNPEQRDNPKYGDDA